MGKANPGRGAEITQLPFRVLCNYSPVGRLRVARWLHELACGEHTTCKKQYGGKADEGSNLSTSFSDLLLWLSRLTCWVHRSIVAVPGPLGYSIVSEEVTIQSGGLNFSFELYG